MTPSLAWPEASPLPIEPLRAVIDRLGSAARRHPEDVHLTPGLASQEGEVAADPPPALEQLTDEFGGVDLHGRAGLDLLVEDRTDLGPYTLLSGPTSYYPLYEGTDVAVVLTLDDHGEPGAVLGIGEDLALRLAAPDLRGWLERYADALEATLAEIDQEVVRRHGPERREDDATRAEVAEDLMDAHLFRSVLGMMPEDEQVTVPILPAAELTAGGAAGSDLPPGTVAGADLRGASLDSAVPIIDADLPGDPLARRISWREKGLLVLLRDGAGDGAS